MSTTHPNGDDSSRHPVELNFTSIGQTDDGFSPAMDPAVKNIQPGGGVVMTLELNWGRLRRWYLRRFRKAYVRKMSECRNGQPGSIPFDPIDARDTKFYRNQDTYWWAEQDDQYRWRDSLPFVRVGLAELILLGGGSLTLAIICIVMGKPLSFLALPLLIVCVLVAWFFRNPYRQVPDQIGNVVSPADGKIVQIERIEDPELGRCVQFGIFLSIFNVHANRVSLPGKVLAIRYHPGKMLNAIRPESARENENLDVILRSTDPDERIFRIRQITGQFARRIVCWIRPGDILKRGEMYGMIKLGSRTELVIPDADTLELVVQVGDKVKAGSTTFARYR